MNPYEKFDEMLRDAADEFKKIDKKEVIRVISHLDADGISACSILIKLLNNDNRKYSISIVQQLNKDAIIQLASEPYNCFIFTDLGSSAVNEINNFLKLLLTFYIIFAAEIEFCKFPLFWGNFYTSLRKCI